MKGSTHLAAGMAAALLLGGKGVVPKGFWAGMFLSFLGFCPTGRLHTPFYSVRRPLPFIRISHSASLSILDWIC